MSRIRQNRGACDLPKWGTQGAEIDHKPVLARMGIITLQERGLKKQKELQKGEITYTGKNELLTRAYKAHITITENQYRQKQVEVSEEDLCLVQSIQESMEQELKKNWHKEMKVNEMQRGIEIALKNTYDELLRKKGHKERKKKKEFLQESTWEEIKIKNEKWAKVRQWWITTNVTGWEQKINRYKAKIRNKQAYEEDCQRDMEEQSGREEGSFMEGWNLWNEWDEQRKKVRNQVKRDKSRHVKEIIEEIGKPEGPENIWKAIDRIAPRNYQNKLALGKEKGGTCLTVEEEKEEIQSFTEKHLKQKRVQEEEGEKGEEEDDNEPTCIFIGEEITDEEWAEQKPLKADVREAFRHTHPNKSTPEWSVPTKMYVIGEMIVAEPIRTLWDKIGKENTYPSDWQIQKTVWIPKPGNKKNEVHKRRGITILDGGAKGYLVWLKKRTGRIMDKNNRSDEYGAVKKRGTSHAILKVLGIRNRMRKNKVCSMTFLGDAVKAFDRISRQVVLKRTEKRLKNEILMRRVITRHQKMISRTILEEGKVDMKVDTGVAQGDPNGPPMYVNGYEEVLEKIEEKRGLQNQTEMPMEMPNWWQIKKEGGKNLKRNTSKTMFVDDHLEVHKLNLKKGKKHAKRDLEEQIRGLVEPILEAQREVGVESGMEKTVILLELHGKGSRRVRKELGGKIKLQNGMEIKIVEQAKYLGVQIGGQTEMNNKEIKDRIEKANKAMMRLTKIWRMENIQLKEKIIIYKTLVTSLLTYATETRIWSNAQMEQLEAIQMRHLRRIAKSPVHITLESNEELRRRVGVPSMTSLIRQRRLRLWHTTCLNKVEEIVAVMWGKDGDETDKLEQLELDREKQLLSDITVVINERQLDRNNFNLNEKGELEIGEKTWKQIGELKKADFKAILTEESEVEKRRKTTFGPKDKPQWECTQCNKKFETKKGMIIHKVKTHNYRVEHRKLVQEVQKGESKHKCLLCNKIYASKQGAQLHLDKHCAHKYTADEIVNALARHGLF